MDVPLDSDVRGSRLCGLQIWRFDARICRGWLDHQQFVASCTEGRWTSQRELRSTQVAEVSQFPAVKIANCPRDRRSAIHATRLTSRGIEQPSDILKNSLVIAHDNWEEVFQ